MPRAVISKKNSGGKFIVMKHNEKRVYEGSRRTKLFAFGIWFFSLLFSDLHSKLSFDLENLCLAQHVTHDLKIYFLKWRKYLYRCGYTILIKRYSIPTPMCLANGGHRGDSGNCTATDFWQEPARVNISLFGRNTCIDGFGLFKQITRK